MSRYVESAVLKIENLASKELAKITRDYKKFGRDIARINAATNGGGGGMAAAFKAQQRAMDAASRSASKYAAVMRDLNAATASQARQSRAMRPLHSTAGLDGGGRGSGRGGGDLQDKIARTISRITVASLTLKAEHVVLDAAKSAVKGTADAAHQRSMLQIDGFDGKTLAAIDKTAQEITRAAPQISVGEALKSIREQYAITGDIHHAQEQAVAGAKRTAVIKSASEGNDRAAMDLGRSAELLLGKRMMTDEGRQFANQLQDQWTKVLIASQGQVKSRDILQMAQQGSTALRRYDFDTPDGRAKALREIGGIIPILSGELGGSKTGTMLTTMTRALNGVMSNKNLGNLERLGLINKGDVLSRDQKGNPSKIKAGAIHGSDKSLFDFVMQDLGPALEKAGELNDPTKRSRAVTELTQNRNVQRAIETILADFPRLAKELANVERMQSMPDAYKTLQQNDPRFAGEGVKAAYETAAEKYLRPAVEPFSKAMNAVTQSLLDVAADGANPAKAAMAGAGAATLGGIALAVQKAADNPNLTLNTAAMAALTAAVNANTAAQGGKLAGALGGAASGATGIVARVMAGIGIAGVVAGAGYVTYQGLGAGKSDAENAKTREMVDLNNQRVTLENLIAQATDPARQAELSAKHQTNAQAIEKVAGEIQAIRAQEAAKASVAKAAEPARASLPSTMGELSTRQAELTAAIRAIEAKLPTKESMPGASKAELDAAAPAGARADLSRVATELSAVKTAIERKESEMFAGDQGGFKDRKTLAKAADETASKVNRAINDGASKFDGTGAKIAAANASFDATINAIPSKMAEGGVAAGAAFNQSANGSALGNAIGAAAAAQIRSAVSGLTVNVNAKPAPNVGQTGPGRG